MKKIYAAFYLLLLSLVNVKYVNAQCSGVDTLTYGFNDPNGAGAYAGYLCSGIDSVGTVGPYGYYNGDSYSIKLVSGSQVTFWVDSCNGTPVSLTINDSLYNIIPGAYSAAACPNSLNFTVPYTGEFFVVINQNGVCNTTGSTLLGEAYVKIKDGTLIPDCPDANLPNDTICGAIALALDSAYIPGNTSQAFPTDPIDGYITSIGYTCSPPNNTLWYSYTATSNIDTLFIRLTSDVGSNFHSWLVVFTSSFTTDPCMNSLSFLGCADGPNDNIGIDSVDIPLFGIIAGNTYYFMIDGYNGAMGGFSIALQTTSLHNSIDQLTGLKNYSAYPNPATSNITITSANQTSASVSLINSVGKTVYNNTFQSIEKEEIDINHLAPGIYILLITNSKETFKERLIIN